MDNILNSAVFNIHIKHLYVFSMLQDSRNPVVVKKLLKELYECCNLYKKYTGFSDNYKLSEFMVSNLDIYLNIFKQGENNIIRDQYFEFPVDERILSNAIQSLSDWSDKVDKSMSINKYAFNSDSKNLIFISYRKMHNMFYRIDKSAFLNYLHSYNWNMKGVDVKNFIDDSHPLFKGILLTCKSKNPAIIRNRTINIMDVYKNPYMLHKNFSNGISFKIYKNIIYQYIKDSSLKLLNGIYSPNGTFGSCHIPMVGKIYDNVTYDLIETMGM